MPELYAKSNPKETLKEHTKKVVEAVEKLEKSKILNDKKFWQYLKDAALIHDFGKVYDGFQEIIKGHKKDDDILSSIHSLISPIFVKWYDFTGEGEKDSKDKENWKKIFLSAVVFHHWRGKINNVVFGNDEEDVLLKINQKEFEKYLKELKKHFKGISGIQNILLDNWNESLKSFRFFNLLIPPDNMMFLPEMIQKMQNIDFDDNWRKKYIFFKGFLMRADHFASSESDNMKKIEIEPLKKSIVNQNILKKINKKKVELWQFNKLEDVKEKNIILIGSTGIGKTEFAFLWGAGKKLIFTLPMRTMVDEIFKRAFNIFDKKVGLLHGTNIISLSQLNKEKDKENPYDFNIDTTKLLSKELSYPVIIGTGDQIFPVALKYPGYEKLMSILGYSKLIIDEVQSYDPIASAIIVKTIEETVKMGGKFLLMTATLPEYIKEEIINRVGKEKLYQDGKPLEIFTKEKTNITKHKIFVSEFNPKEKEIEQFYKDYKNIIEENQDKKILIIVNTVQNAQNLYNRIKDDGYNDILLLHSRFISEHRNEKIQRITGEKKPHILITTQIVEASVDIDYDILITELAPLESLIQRMGRVNRNRVKYQKGCGDVYIWNAFLKGTSYVYNAKLLEWTCEILNDYNEKLLSEKQKQELLKKYYKGNRDDKDDPIRKIIGEFKMNLEALDNLYTANSRAEANKMFRDIRSINVIPESKINDIKSELNNAKNKTAVLEILLTHSISIPWNWKFSGVELQTKIQSTNTNKKLLQGYYVSEGEYSPEKGLIINYNDKESTSPVSKKDNFI